MEITGKTALVFGPTGAVGQELLHLLLNDHRYEKVIAFSRKVIPIEHPKLVLKLNALTNLEDLSAAINGDELYCCLGTTRRKAGSKGAFRKVDLEMPAELARISSANEVRGFIVISSIGAGRKGKGFYLDTKTEMEQRVIQHDLKKLAIVRPSLLLAKRDELRIPELSGKILDRALGWAMKGKLERFRGIEITTVARAMIRIMNTDTPGKITWESEELRKFDRNGTWNG